MSLVARKRDWAHAEVVRLISEYEEKRCLWDPQQKGYRDRNVRGEAIRDLALSFHATEDDIKCKIHGLRNQFCGEIRKQAKKRTNEGTDEIYVSKWAHFQSLMFLMTVSTNERNNFCTVKFKEDYESEDSVTEIINMETTLEPIVDKRGPSSNPFQQAAASAQKPKRKKSIHDGFLEEICTAASRSEIENELDVFGKFVAAELKSLNSERIRKKVKRSIQRVILDAQEEDDNETLGNERSNNVYIVGQPMSLFTP